MNQEPELILETKSAVEVSDPAALTLATLSGEGYEVSLSLESAFQLADMETPSIGAVGAEVGGESSQLNPVTTAVAEGGGAPISGGPEGRFLVVLGPQNLVCQRRRAEVRVTERVQLLLP